MGVATISIRPRETQANTPANVIETANAFWQALEDAGMQRVSTSAYAGQAGRLVSGTPGADQTQFIALGTGHGIGASPYNVYKHPTLNLYLKAFGSDLGFGGGSSRMSFIRFGVFFDLDGAGSHVVSGYSEYRPFEFSSMSISTTSSGVSTTYRNTFVSVGPDHFVLYGDAETVPAIATTHPNSYWYAPGKVLKGIGIFADTDGAGSLVVVSPSHMENYAGSASSDFFNGYSSPSQYNNAYRFTAIRYWSCEPGAKVFAFRGGAAAGFITDPATPASGAGTRVQQARMEVQGALAK